MNQETSPPSGETIVIEADNRWFVRIALLVVGMLFVGMVGLIYWQWLKTPSSPAALVVVQGTAAVGEVELSLYGPNLHSPRTARLTAENDWLHRFPVSPGHYTLTVDPEGQSSIETRLFQVREHQYSFIELEKLLAGGRP